MNTYIDVRPDARLKGFRILRKRDVAQRWMENVPLCGLGVLQCHNINSAFACGQCIPTVAFMLSSSVSPQICYGDLG